jgi:hypothetical protein
MIDEQTIINTVYWVLGVLVIGDVLLLAVFIASGGFKRKV